MQEQRLAFGQFLLNPGNGILLRRGELVPIGRRGALLLELFLKRQGEVLTKAELMDAAWSGMAVEESNLSVQIALLRKAVGTAPGGGEWIVTIPRVGYRFLDALRGLEQADENISHRSHHSRCCRSAISAAIPSRSSLPMGWPTKFSRRSPR